MPISYRRVEVFICTCYYDWSRNKGIVHLEYCQLYDEIHLAKIILVHQKSDMIFGAILLFIVTLREKEVLSADKTGMET